MSDEFKSQDHFRYKKLGKKWRRPVGLQSKLRIRRGGSGRRPAIGFKTSSESRHKVDGYGYYVVYSAKDLQAADGRAAVIGSSVGVRKVLEIAEEAKKHNLRILNRKKIKHAKGVVREIEKKRSEKKQKKEAKKEESHKDAHKEEKKSDKHAVKEEQKTEA